MRTAVLQRSAMAFVVVLLPLRLISADLCARPSFAPARNFSAGPFPTAVVVGDFNNDSKPDLAVANKGEGLDRVNGSVSIHLGNGDGTFQAAVDYALGTNVISVVAGDFNRDTNLDLAALIGNDPSTDSIVLILLGNGDGQFTQGATYPADWHGTALGVGDLNGDGNPDLVTNGYSISNGHVLLGNGDGTFSELFYDSFGDPLVSYLGLGDFNSDGLPDLFLPRNAAAISIRLGNGDGSFQEAIINETSLGGPVESGTMGDFNRDGRLDVAFSYDGDATVAVLIGNGDGTFQNARSYDAFRSRVVTDDFNGDGKLDLVLAAYAGSAVSVWLGAGDGTFEPSGSFPVGAASTSIAAGDFNRDGNPDLAVAHEASGVVSVLLNTCGSIDPQLAVLRSDASVRISWAAPSLDFVLESTTNLALTNWQAAVEAPMTNAAGRLEVSIPLDRLERYFRLRSP